MKVSILIPCHNEEKSIQACVQSCLDQTRPADQILVVNDGSTDGSSEILQSFGDKIEVLNIPVATGNKSYAQEQGLKYITGDIFIATDGDTILHKKLVESAVRRYEKEPEVAAVCGYVKSIKYNWLTAYRETEYVIGQTLFKTAQAYLDAIFVIPGCSGAFRTQIFREVARFDHDTLTEDLDFTYKLHNLGLRIAYERDMVAYTQDPDTLRAYINQMRRWYAGGWQNLRKHLKSMRRPNNIFQLSLNYIEGLIFSVGFFIMPLINLRFFQFFIIPLLASVLLMGSIAALVRKRWDLFLYSPMYTILVYVNAYVFLEQFWNEVILKKTNLVWYQPTRRIIKTLN